MTKNSEKTTFSVQPRQVIGKKVKQLRKTGIIPVNVNGFISEPLALQANRVDFDRLFAEVGETGLVFLKVDGESKERPVLVEQVSYDPLSDAILHVTLKQVNLSEKITAEVPVELVGENKVPGTVIVTVVNAVEVEALPADFPDKFEVDISLLTEIGQSVTYGDLKFDHSLVTLLVEEDQRTTPIVLLQEQVEEPAEEPSDEVAETTTEAAAVEDGKNSDSTANKE